MVFISRDQNKQKSECHENVGMNWVSVGILLNLENTCSF